MGLRFLIWRYYNIIFLKKIDIALSSRYTIPMAEDGMRFIENEAECGYFPEKRSTNLITNFQWLDSKPLPKYLDCIFYLMLIAFLLSLI